MEKNEYDFVKNIENIPDESILKTIRGISGRIDFIAQKENWSIELKKGVISDLETKLGVFIEEAGKRGLNV